MSIWFTARGAGLAALVLLSLTTALGAVVSRPGRRPADRSWLLQYVHRATATLGLGVLVLHVVTILLDSYAHVGITGAIVPFTAGYRPTAVGLGTLAVYVLIGVTLLGVARGRLARSERAARTWRRLHAAAYGGWALAVLHGLLAGTDTGQGWTRLVYVLCTAAVAGGLAWRLLAVPRSTAPPVRVLQGASR